MSYQRTTKTCQFSGQEFIIEPEDFEFYDVVGVPPPTFSPIERMRRRMSFLNDRHFHRRTCDLTGDSVVSLFPAEAEVPVYSPPAWWSDEWNPMDYGVDYDWNRPFFAQFYDLMRRVPQFSLQSQYSTLVNSDYTMMGTDLRNCYMVTNTSYSEDCSYVTFCLTCRNCLDVYMCDQCEFCFESVNLKRCNRTIYSVDCEDCFEVSFCKNLRGCSNCFGCFNLHQKSYYIFNEPYSKEEYQKKMAEFDTGSYKFVQDMLEKFTELDISFPKRFMEGTNNVDVSGNYIYQSKNAQNCFEVVGLEDCKYCQFCFYKPIRDAYDMTFWGSNARYIYDCMGAGGNQNMIKFCFDAWTQATNIEYSYHIVAPNDDLFGCIGLKNQQYCILNKQYSKSEYEEMIPKIKQHMMEMPYIDTMGRSYGYGEFFPSELSFFGYNHSLAYSYLPLEKQQATDMGLNWTDESTGTQHQVTLPINQLPDNIADIGESILSEVIGSDDAKPYRVVQTELQLLRQLKVPIPRQHPNERHYARTRKHNPMQLWERITEDGVQVETTYAPDRPERILSEEGYQREVF